MTVDVAPGRAIAKPKEIARFRDVATALAACWASERVVGWTSLTVRVAFKRDGTVFGTPRVPFVDAADPSRKGELARSLLDALGRCTPLPFTPSLGAAVAGEIFAIRFINQDRHDDRHR